MTATTKEILGQFASLYEGVTTAIPRPREYREADRERLFHLVLTELPALLSDSERLAAIEAVTGEEVRDAEQSLLKLISACAKILPTTAINEGEKIVTVLDSLSAKVAEQAVEIEGLRKALIQCGRNVGGFLADDVSTDFLMYVPEEARIKIQDCNDLIAQSTEQRDSAIRCQAALIRERDTLRRLLTETAAPALEHCAYQFESEVAGEAFGAICARVEAGND